MTHTERHIVETYSGLFERLSSGSKLELLERLAKSIKKGRKAEEKDFFNSFGAFASEKPAEELVKEIRESRKFSTGIGEFKNFIGSKNNNRLLIQYLCLKGYETYN